VINDGRGDGIAVVEPMGLVEQIEKVRVKRENVFEGERRGVGQVVLEAETQFEEVLVVEFRLENLVKPKIQRLLWCQVTRIFVF